jgi:hypothetical protein
MKNDSCFLLIIKNEHKYFFKYRPGGEKGLFFSLIEYGKDDRYNITLIEVLHLIRKMSAHLRENGDIRNFTFHVTPEESD